MKVGNGTSYPHLRQVLAYHTRIILHNDPQIAADLVSATFAIGLFSFMPEAISPAGVFLE
ncbi:MAG: hypothetical protein WBZ36_08365 [Candidatus Nitrosopolaris sp.]